MTPVLPALASFSVALFSLSLDKEDAVESIRGTVVVDAEMETSWLPSAVEDGGGGVDEMDVRVGVVEAGGGRDVGICTPAVPASVESKGLDGGFCCERYFFLVDVDR